MRVFRRVVLPLVWVLIFGTIAVSLGVLAFGGSRAEDSDPATPTGEIPASQARVERGRIDNTLTLDGTIKIDPPATVTAPVTGKVNHLFERSGAWVEAGEKVLQIRTEEVPEETAPEGDPTDAVTPGTDDDPAPAPAPAAAEPDPVVKYTTVTAPARGRLSSLVKVGDDATEKDKVATITRDTFRAVGTIAPIDRYRLLDEAGRATVTIKGGPAPFRCRGLLIGSQALNGGTEAESDPGADPDAEESVDPGAEGEDAAETEISCRVPRRVRVFDGLSMSMKIEAGSATDVLTVPVTAVRGSIQAGTVWVVFETGEEKPVKVELGISDGARIEVASGLEEGQQILEFVPGSEDEAMQGPGMDGEVPSEEVFTE